MRRHGPKQKESGVPAHAVNARKTGERGPLACPHCGQSATLVYDSRAYGSYRRRSRWCANCDKRFTTKEVWVSDDGKPAPPTEEFSKRHAEWYARQAK